jgi:chromosome segregation protein
VYLKALEIQGFKSFPDKTILTFGNDITAIVGPNGSGKSNISDAIRWVMGEQSSKALRGAKMEDVIFGGTQKRAQVGFAEVSLILDNQDSALAVEATEVMVTRRYYRSGDSEYYINKQSARLKDINELFMDTGLGREGYSNIGQGRIDEILSVKSGDRREIFEEAAGISKYRHRKEDTERKLDSTEDNLVRIRDKIAELELQVEPLRVQAEKAKKFLVYRDELRGLEVTVWLDSLEKLAEAARKAEEDHRSAAFLLQNGKDDLESLYRRAEELSQSLRACDCKAEDLRGQIGDLEAQRQKCDGDAAVLRANFENNAANMERIRQELSDQQDRSGSLAGQIAERESRIAEIQTQRAALQQTMAETTAAGKQLAEDSSEATAQLLQLRQEQAATLSRAAEQKASLSAASTAVQELLDRQTNGERDRTEAKERRVEARTRAEACQQSLSKAREEVTSVKNTIAGYELRARTRQQKRDALQKTAQEQGVELSTASSRIKLFQEMERDYEGYSKSVKVVMQEARRGNLRNIHGPVSQLLQTRDDYAVAIETALGSSMQSIVVSAEEDGKAAINLLKRRDSGRATFLPLSAIRGRILQERGLESCAGFVGLASDLVEYAPQYRDIFENLLGRTVIAESMDDAIAMARRFGHRFRIVTLDGQVLNAGGSMTGGSASRSSGVISRANELRRLTAYAKELQAQQQRTQRDLQEAQRLVDEVQFELTTAQGQLRKAEDTVLQLEGEARHYTILIESIERTLESYESDLGTIQTRIDTGRAQIAQFQEAVRQLQEESDSQALRAQALAEGQTAMAEKTAALSEQLTRLRMDIAALDAEEQTARDSITQLSGLAEALHGDRAQREQLLENYETENRRLHDDIVQIEGSGAGLDQQLDELRQTLKTVLDGRMELEAQKTSCEKDAQGKNKDLLLMERECARLEQKKATTAMEEKQILDKLWENYELTRSAAMEARQNVESISAAQKRISELKRKISSLGNPNIGAIDEFARVNERYEYLRDQQNDVEKSKRELEAIIKTLTSEMTTIFKAEFEKINTYFKQTFVEMFGGGRASLELEDPDNVLACGIEIKVQPPGKQLKTLTLLSGGEKAFVAIALYFAIMKVRPTPFCMLDEIDAALDDRNVARFAHYLRGLADHTQFIVITHRRGTMEEADVLYGVTMQEQGVSKVLSMDLNRIAKEMHIN